MRVAIVGSRDYPDIQGVWDFVASLPPGTVVVSGGARGVDTAAYKAAKERTLPTRIWFADWNKYGKRAGFLRNEQIVNDCDRLVAFWDGKSKGTMHSIRLAATAGKEVTVFTEARHIVYDHR